MKRLLSVALCLAGSSLWAAPAPPRPASSRPKLLVLIAVDQLRYDYLLRFREQFSGGLARLLARGAVFTEAHLEHYPSVTAVGHSAMLTGATPASSGIIGNDWYERASRGNVTSVSDPTEKLVGAVGSGTSPRRLLVSTVGDEIKMAGRGSSRVIGLSFKDRSAILPAGRMGDGAFWFDSKAGNFVSSTYYSAELPGWVSEFNTRRLVDSYAGLEWKSAAGQLFKRLPAVSAALYGAVYESSFGNDLLEALAEAALQAENLGRHETTDVLSVSFSSNDAVGHEVGPDAPEVQDITLRTDRVLQKLFDAIERSVGLAHTVVVLTADHGVAPLPEKLAERRMPGGRYRRADMEGPVDAALKEAYGPGDWVAGRSGSSTYLNLELVRDKHLDEAAVERTVARSLAAAPHVARVYTREQLLLGQVPDDPMSRRILRSFNAQRSGDVEVLMEPYWIREGEGATHGTPYSYDTHIPLVLMGPGLKAGRYHHAAALNDLAPTLATLLEVETPSGSVGRVLDEALAGEAATSAASPRPTR